jgi:hypothetical protein
LKAACAQRVRMRPKLPVRLPVWCTVGPFCY